MASVVSASLAIPSLTGIKTVGATTSRVMATTVAKAAPTVQRLVVRVTVKEVGVAVVATADNALAIEILLGSSDGSLVFEPNNFSIASGEKIVFKNNAEFPHNVVFDKDEVPAGVDLSKISMSEEDLLNSARDIL